jgi:hypothetical protein
VTADAPNDDALREVPEFGDERSAVVWRQWLESMARDPEAALAAAIAYRDLDAEGRERWLASLASDGPRVSVPKVAIYAPLLAVEVEPERRARIVAAMGEAGEAARPTERARGFVGRRRDGSSLYVLVLPLYLDFVQVLACSVQGGCFEWVRHDPVSSVAAAPRAYQTLEGVRLEAHPVKAVLDDLALVVLSHRRAGQVLPEALMVLVDLLGELGP